MHKKIFEAKVTVWVEDKKSALLLNEEQIFEKLNNVFEPAKLSFVLKPRAEILEEEMMAYDELILFEEPNNYDYIELVIPKSALKEKGKTMENGLNDKKVMIAYEEDDDLFFSEKELFLCDEKKEILRETELCFLEEITSSIKIGGTEYSFLLFKVKEGEEVFYVSRAENSRDFQFFL